MANASLPTSVAANNTNHISNHNTIHAEVNELSRSTGLRDVSSYLINGWTATYVRVKRERDLVTFCIKGLNGTSATSTRVMDFSGGAGIGTGFSPKDTTESPTFRRAGDFFDARISASLTAGIYSVLGHDWGTTAAREFTFVCTASWPATLPGTAVA